MSRNADLERVIESAQKVCSVPPSELAAAIDQLRTALDRLTEPSPTAEYVVGPVICECGDYIHQHVDEKGKCLVCGDGTAPWDGCQVFRPPSPIDRSLP